MKPEETFTKKRPRNKRTVIIFAIILLIILAATACFLLFAKKDGSTDKNSAKTPAKTLEGPKTTTKTVTETTPIPFTTTTQDDNTLAKGKSKIVQAGVDGVKTTTYEVTYDASGKEISRTVIKEETTTEPVNEIVANGTYVAPAANTTTTTTPTQPATATTHTWRVRCPAPGINAALNPDFRDFSSEETDKVAFFQQNRDAIAAYCGGNAAAAEASEMMIN